MFNVNIFGTITPTVWVSTNGVSILLHTGLRGQCCGNPRGNIHMLGLFMQIRKS
jgi:hypothetical protein